MTRPTLTGRLARWAVLLMQFDITYMPQKAVKGQALADFLAAHPLPVCSPLNDELPDEQILEVEEKTHLEEWELYFDGASSIRPARPPKLPTVQVGIGLIFVTPQGGILRYSYSLIEPRTNNEAEYEALIAGLELAINMQIVKLRIHGDSQLIIKQIDGAFQIHKPELIPYREYALKLLEQIPEVTLIRW